VIITLHQLDAATGCGVVRAQTWLAPVNETLQVFSIDTGPRAAAFLATVAHETGGLRLLSETWGPTMQQARYERDFKAAWPPTKEDDRNSLAYGLGNVNSGDGYRYRGRALLESTGRANYARRRNRLRLLMGMAVPDFEADPDAMLLARWGALASGDYWDEHAINAAADAGNFDAVSDLVNRGHKTPRVGDSIGWPDRLARFQVAQRVFATAGATA
jgi:putative chitinase